MRASSRPRRRLHRARWRWTGTTRTCSAPGKTLYTLNPRMVHRTTMPKGASPYPRPPLTANFALLEAKRLLNIMDYALLQGGTNYIVVAKQGSDKLPAQQPEIDNLTDQVRTASRTGVLVGDHRLDIEIITPKLDELLNPEKRKLIGRKLAMALLRIPEQVTHDAGQRGRAQRTGVHRPRSPPTGATSSVTSRARLRGDRRAQPVHLHSRGADALVPEDHPLRRQGLLRRRGQGARPWRHPAQVGRRGAGLRLRGGRRSAQAREGQRRRRGDDARQRALLRTRPSRRTTAARAALPARQLQQRAPGASARPGPGPAPAPAHPPRAVASRPRSLGRGARRRTVRVGELTAAVLEEYPDHTVGRVTRSSARPSTRARYAARTRRRHPGQPGYEVTAIRASSGWPRACR
jgi:hypothetical protein